MPAISVIIPVYNVEQYIERCVRSLFSQTLEDIEFIFIDDCSPDDSVAVAREVLDNEFPARKPQARFFRMPVNSGQAAVRMKGLGLATGEYVIHCDADDELLSPDAYGLMYGKAVAGNLDIVSCNYLVEDAAGHFPLFVNTDKQTNRVRIYKICGRIISFSECLHLPMVMNR